MGYVLEELVRRLNEALDENPGERFTPREVVRLMVLLVIMVDLDIRKQEHIIRTVCDPCCGTGGMVTIAKDQIPKSIPTPTPSCSARNPSPKPSPCAKADLYMKCTDGRDAENIKYGSTMSN